MYSATVRADEPAAPAEPVAAPTPATPATPAEPVASPTPATPAPAPAEGFRAYDTAATMPAGKVQVGVFAPLRWGINESFELEIHPLLSLVAPSPTLRVRHVDSPGFTLTGEYGFSYQSFLFGQSIGYFFPSGAISGQLQQTVVLSAGLAATLPVSPRASLTARANFALGIPLTAGVVRPTDSFHAPFEVLLAPMLRGYRAQLGVSYDRELLEWLRLRTTLNAFLVGAQPAGYAQSSQAIYSWHLGVDFRTGGQSRLTLGAIWWNWDNFQTDVVAGADGFSKRVRVRTNDVYPTIDYVFAF